MLGSLALALASALACSGATPPSLEDTVKHDHPDGFSFQAPADSEIVDTAGRATVHPQGWRDQRSPYQLRVEATETTTPDASLADKEQRQGREIHYLREELAGGSSGPQHRVEAHVLTPEGRAFRLELVEHAEARRAPHETVLWTVAESLAP